MEADAAKPARDALERYREAIDFLCGYVRDRGYDMRFALEPKPNEPRGDIFLPTVGHMLAFIERLEHPEMVGVNPEVAHDTMAGLSFLHARGAGAVGRQALPHRPERPARSAATTRTSASARWASRTPSSSSSCSRTPATTAPRHFDARPLRVESEEGIWDFAAGCMRTYLALKERRPRSWGGGRGASARAEADAKVPELGVDTVGAYSRERSTSCSPSSTTSTRWARASAATSGSTSWRST